MSKFISDVVFPPEALSKRAWTTLLLVCCSSFVSNWDLSTFSLALPQLQKSLDIGNAAALSRFAATVRGGAIFSVFITALADLPLNVDSAAVVQKERSSNTNTNGSSSGWFSFLSKHPLLLKFFCRGGGRVGGRQGFNRQGVFTLTVSGLALATLATSVAPTADTLCAAQVAARAFGTAESMLAVVLLVEVAPVRCRGFCLGLHMLAGAAGYGAGALGYTLLAPTSDTADTDQDHDTDTDQDHDKMTLTTTATTTAMSANGEARGGGGGGGEGQSWFLLLFLDAEGWRRCYFLSGVVCGLVAAVRCFWWGSANGPTSVEAGDDGDQEEEEDLFSGRTIEQCGDGYACANDDDDDVVVERKVNRGMSELATPQTVARTGAATATDRRFNRGGESIDGDEDKTVHTQNHADGGYDDVVDDGGGVDENGGRGGQEGQCLLHAPTSLQMKGGDRQQQQQQQHRHRKEQQQQQHQQHHQQEEEQEEKQGGSGVSKPLTSGWWGRVGTVCCLYAPLALGLSPATSLVSTFLQQERGLSPQLVGSLYLVLGPLAMGLSFLAAKGSDLWGRRRVCLAASLAMVCGFELLYAPSNDLSSNRPLPPPTTPSAPPSDLASSQPAVEAAVEVVWGVGMPLQACLFGWVLGLAGFVQVSLQLSAFVVEIFPPAERGAAAGLSEVVFTLAGSFGLVLESVLCEWGQQRRQQEGEEERQEYEWQQDGQQRQQEVYDLEKFAGRGGEGGARQGGREGVFEGARRHHRAHDHGATSDEAFISLPLSDDAPHAPAVRALALVGLGVTFAVFKLIPPDRGPPASARP